MDVDYPTPESEFLLNAPDEACPPEGDQARLPVTTGRLFSYEEFRMRQRLKDSTKKFANKLTGAVELNERLSDAFYTIKMQDFFSKTSRRSKLYRELKEEVFSIPNAREFFLTNRRLAGANSSDLEEWLATGNSPFRFDEAFKTAVLTNTLYDPNAKGVDLPEVDLGLRYITVDEITGAIANEQSILLLGPKARAGTIVDMCRRGSATGKPFIIVFAAKQVPEGVREAEGPRDMGGDFETIPDYARFEFLNRVRASTGYPKLIVLQCDEQPEQAVSFVIGMIVAAWEKQGVLASRKLGVSAFDFSNMAIALSFPRALERRYNTSFIYPFSQTPSVLPERFAMGRQGALMWAQEAGLGFRDVPQGEGGGEDLEDTIRSKIQEAWERGQPGDARRILEEARARGGVTSYYYTDLRSVVACEYLRALRNVEPLEASEVEIPLQRTGGPSQPGESLTAYRVGEARLTVFDTPTRWAQAVWAQSNTLAELMQSNPEVRSAFNVVEAEYSGKKLTKLVFVPNDDLYAMWVAFRSLSPDSASPSPSPSRSFDSPPTPRSQRRRSFARSSSSERSSSLSVDSEETDDYLWR